MNTRANFNYTGYYHIYNRTNNKEILFKESMNKKYFLNLLAKRISPYAHILACALLGNHFHLIVKIKTKDEILNMINTLFPEEQTKLESNFLKSSDAERDVHKLVSKQFSRVFNSYTQAINKKYNRSGNLFHKPFKRSFIQNYHRLRRLIYYVHHNSRKHKLVDNFVDDTWHSYHYIMHSEVESIWNGLINAERTIRLYGSKNKFIEFHNQKYLKRDLQESELD